MDIHPDVLDWIGWYLAGVSYRAPYGANILLDRNKVDLYFDPAQVTPDPTRVSCAQAMMGRREEDAGQAGHKV